MSYELINTLRGPSKLTVVDGSATIGLADLSANANTENVTSAVITSIKWSLRGAQGDDCTITRDAGGGANVVATLSYSGFWPHDELAIANTSTGNITVTISGGGTCILALKKQASYNVDVQQL